MLLSVWSSHADDNNFIAERVTLGFNPHENKGGHNLAEFSNLDDDLF